MNTVNASMGLVAAVAGRNGERGGKEEPAAMQGGFDDVLTTKATTKRPQRMQRDEDAVSGLRELIRAIAADELGAAASQRDDDNMPSAQGITVSAFAPATPNDPETPATDPQDKPVARAGTPDETAATPILAGVADSIAPVPLPAPPVRESGPAPALTPNGTPDTGLAAAPNGGGATIAPLAGGSAGAPATAPAIATTDMPAPPSGRPADTAATQPASPAPQRSQGDAPDMQRTMANMTAGERTSEASQPRVTVLGFNTATAPAQLSATSAGMVAVIEAEPTWRAAAAEAAAATTQRGPGHHHNVSTLRIQLNPAELGMVTARLVANGPQLEIEIKVESNDARQRLANDSDAIIKALRAVGYDVDRITIQQASQSGNAATQQQGGQSRDTPMQEQGRQQADANAGGRNGQNGAGEDSEAARRAAGATLQERSGGDVYI